MTTVRPKKTTLGEHLTGSGDSWHGQISQDGPFHPEPDRYHMYIGKLTSPRQQAI